MALRVLVVDDTALYRKVVSDILRELPEVEVVGTAINGRMALEKVAELKPDLVTLDLELPDISGVEVLRQLQPQATGIGVIMLSAFTSAGAEATMQALRLGAFDVVLKPAGSSLEASRDQLSRKLSERLNAFAGSQRKDRRPVVIEERRVDPLRDRNIVTAPTGEAPEVIVMGISTGGPEALTHLIPALPRDLPAPLLIVQHMPPLFTKSLAEDLDRRSHLEVAEATHGQIAQAGQCLIAPGGKQMRIERTDAGPLVHITNDPPENSCRPAVDYLFRSAAHHYGAKVLAAVLTGMGNDGERGCRLLKRHGAVVLAQDQATCVVYGMPRAVVDNGLADEVLPLGRFAERITQYARQGVNV